MNKLKYSILYFFFLFFLFSCDILEPTNDIFYVQETDENISDSTENYEKKVVLIEFTGHLCTNCPDAHRNIEQMQEVFGEKLIPIAIHAGYFARLEPSAGFTSDYRTEEGTDLYEYFGEPATPAGVVNSLDKNNVSAFSAWSSNIEDEIAKEPIIGINIENSFSQSDRKLNVDIEFEALTNYNSDIYIWACIIENNIISNQLDDGEIVENYSHKHVLRKILTDTFGNSILSNNISIGSSGNLNLIYNLETKWNENNCAIVVFIYDKISNEILNSQEKKVLE